jgi:hypothetical protein
MLFTLTYFHLYWEIIILQEIYTNTVENVKKIRFLTKHRKEIRREAHLPCKSRPSTDMARTRAHLESNHTKMVASGASPSAAVPRVHSHLHHRLSGPPSVGGAIMTLRVSS